MNEKPESIWKKSWHGPRAVLLRLTLFLVGLWMIVTLLVVMVVSVFNVRQPGPFYAVIVLVAFLAVLAGFAFLTYPLICWLRRNLRKVLFVCACLATLIALFYAEEDWRGWRAWHQFQQTWESRGMSLDLASCVPPPVPDAQNFAMTPIVFTSYGDILTRAGKVIPSQQRDPHFVRRMNMPIADGAEPSNCDGDRLRGIFTSLEGWQGYYRQLAAKTNDFPVPAQPQSPARDVLLALSKYDSAVEELRAASKLPESRYPLEYDRDSPWEILLPHLAPLKGCARLLQLRSAAELQNGQPDNALADVQLGLDLTGKIRTEPFLISHFVRVAMVQLMLQTIWEGLARHQWSDAQLAALDTDLAGLDFVTDYRLGMRGELGGQTGEMDLIRRHPGQMDVLEDFNGGSSDVFPFEVVARLTPTGWFYQNEYHCARLMTDYFYPAADAEHRTFSPHLVQQGGIVLVAETQHPFPFNLYERLMLPGLTNAARRFAWAQATVDTARVAMALERYRLARGEFPESLDALAPQYIAQLPRDVIGGQPLKYRREADGQFVLYSIGWNETDDGGVAVFENGSSANRFLDEGSSGKLDLGKGDWVWQYPKPMP